MEGINKVQRSPEELEEARRLGEHFKYRAHQHGGVDVERDRIDALVEAFAKGDIDKLVELEAKGEKLIEGMQGDH